MQRDASFLDGVPSNFKESNTLAKLLDEFDFSESKSTVNPERLDIRNNNNGHIEAWCGIHLMNI